MKKNYLYAHVSPSFTMLKLGVRGSTYYEYVCMMVIGGNG